MSIGIKVFVKISLCATDILRDPHIRLYLYAIRFQKSDLPVFATKCKGLRNSPLTVYYPVTRDSLGSGFTCSA